MKRVNLSLLAGSVLSLSLLGQAQESKPEVEQLTKQLWPKERIEQALKSIEQQKADGLMSEAQYAKRKQMLQARRDGVYKPESLSATDPPLNFIQNGGFEQTNSNSAKNRSRWLWWGGWSWGGDYENMWEAKPEHVHSGKLSARIRCTGAKGRIGISTPPLPSIPGVKEYKLTFWGKGEGDNMLFVNFEEGATGTVREKMSEQWQQHTLSGKPTGNKNTYTLYFYVTGAGTIWLDDIELVPVGGTLE